MSIPHVDYKLPGTRKVRNFIIYPPKPHEERYLIQSDDAILSIDKVTGYATYNIKAGGAYGTHLAHQLGAKDAVFTDLLEIIKKTLEPIQDKTITMVPGVGRVQY